jgi:hypothetical protein
MHLFSSPGSDIGLDINYVVENILMFPNIPHRGIKDTNGRKQPLIGHDYLR